MTDHVRDLCRRYRAAADAGEPWGSADLGDEIRSILNRPAETMIPLDPAAPLRSLRALAPGVSHRAHGAARVPPVSDVAVVMAEHAGARIQVSTLVAYAAALGYELVIGVKPIVDRR